MKEWRCIEGYVGRYAVSNEGEVMSMDFAQSGLPGLLKPRLKKGYHHVNLCDGERVRTRTIHALVAAAFIGPRPAGLQINHRNGVKNDNRVSNLEYVTPAGNTRHAIETGLRDQRGEGSGMAKFKNEDILRIRRLRAFGVGPRELAKEYGVNRTCIQKIVRRETWSHVAEPAVEGVK